MPDIRFDADTTSVTPEGSDKLLILRDGEPSDATVDGLLGKQHNHTESDITDLDKYSQTEVNNLLDGKSDSNHNHDDRYYQKSQVDTSLSSKSDTGHNHDERYYQKGEVDMALSGKSESDHNHDNRYYTDSEVNALLNSKGDVNNVNQNTANRHTHSNKSILDNIDSQPVEHIQAGEGIVITRDGENVTVKNSGSINQATTVGNIAGLSDYVTNGTDDHIEIQQALNDIDSAGGGILYLYPGDYNIGATLTVGSNTMITGPGAKLIQQNDLAYRIIENKNIAGGNTNIHINYLGFEGKKGTFTNGEDVFFMDLLTDCSFKNLVFNDCLLNAIRGRGDRCSFEEIYVQNAKRQGINRQGTAWNIHKCYIDVVDDEFGIVIGGYSKNVDISFNKIKNTNRGGIEWGYSGENITISNNIVINCDEGVEVQGFPDSGVDFTKNCLISDNLFLDCVSGVLVRRKSSAPGTHVVSGFIIQGNSMINNTGEGIRLDECSDIEVKDNTIENSPKGVEVNGGVTGYIIKGNRFKSITSQIITVSSPGAIIIDNVFDTVTYDAVSMNGGLGDERIINNYYKGLGRDFIRNQSVTAIVEGNIDIS